MCEILINIHVFFANMLSWAFLNEVKGKIP